MARITVEDCIDKFESRFELVLVASNRARKLHSGENPTIEKDNDKNTVIALREISVESLNIEDMKNNLVEEYQTVSIQNDEDLSLEYEDSEKDNINKNDSEDLNNKEDGQDLSNKDDTEFLSKTVEENKTDSILDEELSEEQTNNNISQNLEEDTNYFLDLL